MRSPLGPPPLIYAHRGDSAHAPDNSIEALVLAVEAGTDGIEVDVRRSSDGVLVLSHDPTHPDVGVIADQTFDTIRDAAPGIPTLEEALASVPRHVFMNVEIKNTFTEPGFDRRREIVTETLALIESIDDLDRLLLSSFDPFSVAHARKRFPSVARGLLVTDRTRLWVGVRWAARAKHSAIHLPRTRLLDDPSGTVEMASERGLLVAAWTVDDPGEMRRLFDAGVSIIITNDPAVGRAVIDDME